MIPFTYAILDCNNEVIKKVRWSSREVKWFKDNHPSFDVVKLERPPKVNLNELVGEALF